MVLTAKLVFSQFPNSIVTNARLCNQTGSGESNMVATKCCAITQEVGNPTGRPRNRKYYISACRPVRKAVSTAKLMFWVFPDSIGSITMMCDITGSGKSNLAAS